MAEEKHWKEGIPTHENVIFTCFGGFSNTGITAALASKKLKKKWIYQTKKKMLLRSAAKLLQRKRRR